MLDTFDGAGEEPALPLPSGSPPPPQPARPSTATPAIAVRMSVDLNTRASSVLVQPSTGADGCRSSSSGTTDSSADLEARRDGDPPDQREERVEGDGEQCHQQGAGEHLGEVTEL